MLYAGEECQQQTILRCDNTYVVVRTSEFERFQIMQKQS